MGQASPSKLGQVIQLTFLCFGFYSQDERGRQDDRSDLARLSAMTWVFGFGDVFLGVGRGLGTAWGEVQLVLVLLSLSLPHLCLPVPGQPRRPPSLRANSAQR